MNQGPRLKELLQERADEAAKRIVREPESGVIVFDEECDRYLDWVTKFRPELFNRCLNTLSAGINPGRGTRLMVCIPCHVDEPISPAMLAQLAIQARATDGHVVIFLNCDASSSNVAKVEQTKRKIADLVGYHDLFSIVSLVFETRQNIGFLRALLTDAAIVACKRMGCEDPIIISNDIDMIAISEQYLQTVANAFDQRKYLDVVAGPTHYGCIDDGSFYLDEIVPELLLGNRFISSFRNGLASSDLLGFSVLLTEGPNTAFRAASYCAVRGYDVGLSSGEDDDLGFALWALRGGPSNVAYVPENADLLDGMWLVTDPRRQMKAIVAGVCVRATWKYEAFEDMLGHNIDLPSLIQAYHLRPSLIQREEISALEQLDQQRIRVRIKQIFDENLSASRLSGGDGVLLAQHYGLVVRDGVVTAEITDTLRQAILGARVESQR